MLSVKNVNQRLLALEKEVREVRKELVVHRFQAPAKHNGYSSKWKSICRRITAKWDKVSVAEEIEVQREKHL